MDRSYRTAFNAAFTPAHYQAYLARMERDLGGPVPFRVAETPLFLPDALRERMVRAATEIVAQLARPEVTERLSSAVPAKWRAPGQDDLPHSVQVDLAIVRDAQGELDCKLVELQGFPSLYAFTVYQNRAMAEQLARMPGLERPWTCYFDGLDEARYVARLRAAIVGELDPREVILMDLHPRAQKTYPDFAATKALLGVDAVCPTTLRREGRTLVRDVGGHAVPVRRIYNRVVFDELEAKGIALPFAYADDLDVSWFSHPNWYWIWSKSALAVLDHPAVPRAWVLSELPRVPDDLTGYILKPLFSFAGSGVKIDVTRADLDAIPEGQRSEWLLQERIAYTPGLTMPDGQGVKAEVRMMFLRAPGDPLPRLVLNLSRLSRGKMHGVDHNRDLDWVGGTVAVWPAE